MIDRYLNLHVVGMGKDILVPSGMIGCTALRPHNDKTLCIFAVHKRTIDPFAGSSSFGRQKQRRLYAAVPNAAPIMGLFRIFTEKLRVFANPAIIFKKSHIPFPPSYSRAWRPSSGGG